MPNVESVRDHHEEEQHQDERLLLVGLSLIVSGQSLALEPDGAEVVVGRSATAGFRIDHLSVSRRHASVVRTSSASGPIVTVTDLGSSHGTFVNDQLISAPMELVDGDTVRVGDIFLRFVSLRGADDLGDFLGSFQEADTSVGLTALPLLNDEDKDQEPTSSRDFATYMPRGTREIARYQLECVRCGARTPGRFEFLCKCGGMLEATYDLAEARFVESENPFQRFGDLLPVRDRSLYPSTARRTPCVHATRLGEVIGLPWLYLKNESRQPTGTTKDRASVIVLAMLLECGLKSFATSSTGNAGSAYAYALQTEMQFSEMEMCLFVGENFHGRSHYGDGARVKVFALRGGSFEDAGAVASAYAKQQNLLSDGGFFSPGKREGAKLAYFEATEQVPRPIDWYVQAISSGLGVQGTFKGAKELAALGRIDRLPRLLCVQEDTCSPQVRAWKEGCEAIKPEHIVHHPRGIALATHRGDPSRGYPYLRASVVESAGTYTAVSEMEIREARQMVLELEGIDICFNSATAVAGVIKEARTGAVRPDETLLVNLTGRDRTPETATKHITWLECKNGNWVSDDGVVSISDEAAFKRAGDAMRRRSENPR